MALYNHFATKDQLVDALLDRVLGRFEPEPATDDWVEDLRRFARAHRRLLVDHPWAVAPLFTQPNPGLARSASASSRSASSGAAASPTRGPSRRSAASSRSTTAGRRSRPPATSTPTGPSHDVGAMLAVLPRAEYPLTVDVADEMGAYGSDDHYDFVLDQFLGGLRAAAGAG